MSLVVVETYPNTMQAHIARGLLDEENYIRAKEILNEELPPDPIESFSA